MRYIGNFRNIATKLNIYTTELLICIERENLSKLIRKLSFFLNQRENVIDVRKDLLSLFKYNC